MTDRIDGTGDERCLEGKEVGSANLASLTGQTEGRSALVIIPIIIESCKCQALLDTGASHNFLPEALAIKLGLSVGAASYLVSLGDGSKLTAVGIVRKVKLCLAKSVQLVDFVVLRECPLILGLEVLQRSVPNLRSQLEALAVLTDEAAYSEEVSLNSTVMNGRREVMSRKELKRALRDRDVEIFMLKALENDNESEEPIEGSKLIVDSMLAESLNEVKQEFTDLFPKQLPGLPPERGVEHSISLVNEEPVFKPSYRLSPKEREVMEDQIKEMLKLGLIRPSTSSFAAPSLFVKKADGQLRMVVDYRALNQKTIRDRFPLPRISDLLDRLTAARFFSKFDLQNGFYQLRVKESDIHKTAFFGNNGLYEFLVMPMGMTNSPSSFQRLMREVIQPSMDSFALVYIDDVLVFSKTRDEHVEHVRKVMEQFRRHQLYLKPSKCVLGLKEISFVGHLVGNGERRIDPNRILEIERIPEPQNIHEIRRFMGVVNFVRDHIPHLAKYATKLSALTKKNAQFIWEKDQQIAFDKIKAEIARNIPLKLPDSAKFYIIETDASDIALGAALLQKNADGTTEPVCFASRSLNKAERNYPTHERELLAIYWACTNFRHYVEGLKFEVKTDHRALEYLLEQPILSRRVARWCEYLARFDFAIMYIKGKENVLADFLSRLRILGEPDLKTISLDETDGPRPGDAAPIALPVDWPFLVDDAATGNLPPNLPTEVQNFILSQVPNFVFDNEEGLLYRLVNGSRRVYLPFSRRADYVSFLHAPQAVHLAWNEVYRRAEERVWWPYMRRDIKKWVQACTTCQLYARNSHQPHAPAQVWLSSEETKGLFGRWHLDFIGPLQSTRNGNQYILTAVEHSIRYPVARATVANDALTVAKFLYEKIFVPFGPPIEVFSDRGSHFTAQLLQEYLRLQEVHHGKTTAYHPRSNGKVENFNGTLTRALAKAVGGATDRWDDFLDDAIYHLSRRKHTTTGYTPYYLLYGQEPRIAGDLVLPPVLFDSSNPRDLAEIRARMLETLGTSREDAAKRTADTAELAKERYDTLVKDDPLEVNEWVLMKRGVAALDYRKVPKFLSNWVGPFKVHATHEYGTYKLMEPCGRLKPDLVHRDRLKRCRIDVNHPPTEFWTDENLLAFDDVSDHPFPLSVVIPETRGLGLGDTENDSIIQETSATIDPETSNSRGLSDEAHTEPNE